VSHSDSHKRFSASSVGERLTSGVGFYLEPSGSWDEMEIPDMVVEKAAMSGHLKINGYECTVFDMPNGDQWAQKTSEPSISPIASRVAARYLAAKKKRQRDIVTQVQKTMGGDSMDDWKQALDKFCRKVDEKFIPYFDELWLETMGNLEESAGKLPSSPHERVNRDNRAAFKAAFKEFFRGLQSVKLQFDQKIEDVVDDFQSIAESSEA
jgi:hypothetical protein